MTVMFCKYFFLIQCKVQKKQRFVKLIYIYIYRTHSLSFYPFHVILKYLFK